MFVLLPRRSPSLARSKLFILVHPVEVNPRWVVLKEPLGSRDQINPIVGMRRRHRMFHRNRQSIRGLDERSIHVARDVSLFPLRIAGSNVIFAVLIQPALWRTHRYDMTKTVAALHAHVVGHRSQPVSRIEISVAQRVLGAAPKSFTCIREQLLAQIVNVSSL